MDLLYHFEALPCEPPSETVTIPPWLPAPYPPTTYPTWEVSIKVCFYVLAMLLGIIGNSVVLIVVALHKKLHNTTNIYLANMAVSDLLVSSFSMWVHLGTNISAVWPFGLIICKVTSFIQALCSTSSVFFMVVIAIDRFLAIVHPLRGHVNRYVTIKNKWVIPVVVVFTWLAAAATAVPQLLYWRMRVLEWSDRTDIFCDEDWPRVYYLHGGQCLTKQPTRDIYITVHVVLLYFTPLLVILFTYVSITKTLWKTNASVSYQQRRYQKVVRMLVCLSATFVVCWTPFQAIVLYDIHRPRDQGDLAYLKALKYFFTYLAYFNSALNPVMYGYLNQNFRKGFWEVFKCCICRPRIHPDGGTNSRWAVTTSFLLFRNRAKRTQNPLPTISDSNEPN